MVLVTFTGCFYEIEAIFGKIGMPSSFCLLCNKKMIIKNFVDSITSFYKKKLKKANFEQVSNHQ